MNEDIEVIKKENWKRGKKERKKKRKKFVEKQTNKQKEQKSEHVPLQFPNQKEKNLGQGDPV